MRLSRPCYDKIWRCPGWAGGGNKYAKNEDRCDSGSIRIGPDPDRSWSSVPFWKWRVWKCNTCDVVIWPYVIRYVDPSNWWYGIKRTGRNWRGSYRHYRAKGEGFWPALYLTIYFELKGREPY